ncbi:hypothetical protein EMGBS10_16260 [Opitutia bacterium]|jgi:hypothetical protein|nr:hypothetical protein EMGBS10_16260 [Opitutae bacterium]
MGTLEHTFAVPLSAVVDESKVEPGQSDLRMLARQLGRWLNHNLDLVHKGTAIESNDLGPMLIVAGVREAQWPVMLALAQTQRCALYLVLPNGQGQHFLKALDVPPA